MRRLTAKSMLMGGIIVTAIMALSLPLLGAPAPAVSGDPLEKIMNAVLADPGLKPLMRRAVAPKNFTGELQFRGQRNLTKPLLEAYLDRAIVHMNLWDDRSREFLRHTSAKFIHWADLGWVRRYTTDDWLTLTAAVDAVHSTEWGADVLFECGIMEAIGRQATDTALIPKWFLTVLTETGIQQQRTPGPKGPHYFSYEAMFDRNAEDWPKHFVGLWHADPVHEQSVPDLTMLETQIYYAYLIAEYIDAGFEGVMFGQTMLTGRRDHDNKALHSICRFARRWAEARGYRNAVTLTSHVIYPADYPKSPEDKARPLFTHLTWPTRMSCTDKTPFGMRLGPDEKTEGLRQGGEEIVRLLQLPHDLPILLEIDNYGPTDGPSAVCDEGYDEITAYASRPPERRGEFLKHYYFESRKWRNREGRARVHFAPSGYRCLNKALSLRTLPDGQPSKPTSFYLPFREDGGEEEIIRALFRKARSPREFAP